MRLTRFLSLFYLLFASSSTLAAPTPVSNYRILTLSYDDVIDISTQQSQRAGQFTLPALPYPYEVSNSCIFTLVSLLCIENFHSYKEGS